MENSYSSKSLDHLGIVSGMIDELGIVEEIDKYVQTDGSERVLSLGLLCKALILNGLGFTQRTMYMVPTFFEGKPTEQLLGKGVQASQLNDTVLGRCLDALHGYGCTTLYANLAPVICKRLGLSPKNVYMDSTDFHVDGVYNSRESEVEGQVIHVRQGYNRDHRPDLNQVVFGQEVKNPTARWIFSCFNGIHVLYLDKKPIVLNMKPLHLKILDILGGQYRKYYFLE